MKSRIKSMIWNIRKQKTTLQNNKKKEVLYKQPLGKIQEVQRSHHRGLLLHSQKEKIKSKELEIYLKKSEKKLP